MKRITFLQLVGAGALLSSFRSRQVMENAPFTLPALPYAFDALEPHIDKLTMEIHHDRQL